MKASPELSNCKPLPKDKYAKGGLDGIYFKDNKYESPLLNNPNTPIHHDSILSDASQVLCQILRSPPMSPSDPPSPGSPESLSSTTSESRMFGNADLYEWSANLASSIVTG